jgi:hypothetical protein
MIWLWMKVIFFSTKRSHVSDFLSSSSAVISDDLLDIASLDMDTKVHLYHGEFLLLLHALLLKYIAILLKEHIPGMYHNF